MVVELPEILLVEDDPADVELTQYTLGNPSSVSISTWQVTVWKPWLFCGKKESLAKHLAPT